MLRSLALAALLLPLANCFDSDDARAELAEVRCWGESCWGRWDGTDQWSRVEVSTALADDDDLDPDQVWECAPFTSVDACGVVDSNGHVACWWVYGAWAVAVAPTCAVELGDGWMPAGQSMAVWATHEPG
jgi:hypothetical protein